MDDDASLDPESLDRVTVTAKGLLSKNLSKELL